MSILYLNDAPAEIVGHAHHYPRGQRPVTFVSDHGDAVRVSFDAATASVHVQPPPAEGRP